MKELRKLRVITFIFILSAQALHAASATWNLNPGSGDWNTATNWTPTTVPSDPTSTATFALSNTTGVSTSAFTEVNGIVFAPGASAFTITASPTFVLTISGVGITNNSGTVQNFLSGVPTGGNSGAIYFTNSATAGSLTAFTADNGQTFFADTSTAGNGAFTNSGGTVGGAEGETIFADTSTAGNGTFTNNGGTVGGVIAFSNKSTAGNGTFINKNESTVSLTQGGFIYFFDTSNAGTGTFTNNGAAFSGAFGGFIYFVNMSSAGNGTFTNNGGTVSGASGGSIYFANTSSPGNGTFTNNGGTVSGANGGSTNFLEDSTGDTARVEVFGNGFLDISLHNVPGVTIGSIEGSGTISLGANNLTVGSNNLSTTFSGVIQDSGTNGSFTKIGGGILTFEGGASNDHIGDTVTLGIASGSIVNLNFTGTPDTVRSLVVGGVVQPDGLYGSAASGAPHQLPEFTGLGTILVTTVTPTPTPTGTPATKFIGLSTRAVVGTGDAVTVNAFVITGLGARRVIVRGLGPSLPFPSVLADPLLELRDSSGGLIQSNDNWRSDQEAEIIATGLPPSNDLESAIVATLAPGVYTVVLRGNNGGTGTGSNEAYDLTPDATSRFTAVGTRGSVLTGNDFLISGVIMQEGGNVVLRALGPSLPVSGRLGDPTLELRDGNGSLIAANNNWQDDPAQAAQIMATGLAPNNPLESAIAVSLPPGNWTAIVGGVNNTTGIGYVQFYGVPHSGPVLPITPTETAPVIISPLVATGTVGLGFSYQFEALYATSLSVTNLPPGLTFNAGLSAITGIPTAEGPFPVGLSASNAVGTTTDTLMINVQLPPISGPTIISATAATGRPGRFFSFQVITSGGSPAATVSATGLPAGLSIDAVTGIISGIPTAEGSSPVTLTVTDGASTTSGILQLTFTFDPALPVIISPGSGSLVAGEFFTYTITADATGTFGYIGDDGIVHLGPSSAGLPSGLSFDGVATISGIYNPGFGRDGGRKKRPDLSGGIVTNVQLFATGPGGTSIIPFIFFPAATGAVNISTRLNVGTGQEVLIAGFIIQGTAPKKVLVRAIGPSLSDFGVTGALQDPTLELRDGAGVLLASNDDWRSTQEPQIIDTAIAPTDNHESAILAYLSPGPYTAIVRGKDETTGVALVEAYDLGTASLDGSSRAKFANISTRGTVLTGDNVMIGGFIVRVDTTRVVIRAIGPSLSAFGIKGALPDPTLDLHDANGSILFNDNWQDDPTQAGLISAAGLAPTEPLESAIWAALPPGNYTATVAGKDGATGVGLIEAYTLDGALGIPSRKPLGSGKPLGASPKY